MIHDSNNEALTHLSQEAGNGAGRKTKTQNFMKSLRNSVTLIGHLGGDPEVKSYSDRKRASFSIATTDWLAKVCRSSTTAGGNTPTVLRRITSMPTMR